MKIDLTPDTGAYIKMLAAVRSDSTSLDDREWAGTELLKIAKHADDTCDRLNAIYDLHKDRFEGSGFHNTLWQIMMNESLAGSPAEHAFLAMYDGMMVIAASDGGHLRGCQVRVKDGATHESGHDKADELAQSLNDLVFGLDSKAAMRIVGKSVGNQCKSPDTPHCDSCADDTSVDCHDCDQYQMAREEHDIVNNY